MYGNIEITSSGDFIRTVTLGGRTQKERFYSPITQNQRHLNIIKRIKINAQKGLISKKRMENCFDSLYKSIVVLANPKSMLNTKYAKKEIKECVILSDQLAEYIKKHIAASNEPVRSDKEMLAWAQSFLALHQPLEKDFRLSYMENIHTRSRECF